MRSLLDGLDNTTLTPPSEAMDPHIGAEMVKHELPHLSSSEAELAFYLAAIDDIESNINVLNQETDEPLKDTYAKYRTYTSLKKGFDE